VRRANATAVTRRSVPIGADPAATSAIEARRARRMPSGAVRRGAAAAHGWRLKHGNHARIETGALPLYGVAIARRGCFSRMQVVERRPVMHNPRRLFETDCPHKVALHLQHATSSNPQKEVVPDHRCTVVV